MKLVLTCEHGGNTIPKKYANNFTDKTILKTHRGYDIGALDLFHFLEPISDASFYSTTSRLLVELNRSLFSKYLFSEFGKDFSKEVKTKILAEYYVPYRTGVEYKIASFIEDKASVLHLSIHSFTPSLNNEQRNCDIGLLYDSRNSNEQKFCKQLKIELLKQNPHLNIRYNYPYLGKADGFTTFLRKQFTSNYLGIEIEVNQNFAHKNQIDLAIKQALYRAIENSKPKTLI